MDCLAWVNTILGNLETANAAKYSAFDIDKMANRNLANTNTVSTAASILPDIVPADHRCRLTGMRPEDWIRRAEDWC